MNDFLNHQWLFNIIIGIIMTLSGWIFRSIYDSLNTLRDNVTEMEKNIFKDFVRKDEYREDLRELKHLLEQINSKLDNKMDKAH